RKWTLITKINKEFDELYHKLAVNYNLSDSSFFILYYLYEAKEPCTQKEICDNWYFNKQTINSAIKKLEDIGYITRNNVDNNRPNRKILLTKLGIEIAEKTVAKIMKIEDIAFSKISEEELDHTIKLLQESLSFFKEEVEKLI
ncbi:MAG: MarR family transcriptional regulator, partial [Clostridia bacterium]|nr:MarR family transcriptional regulator [Clostridia bacterium]